MTLFSKIRLSSKFGKTTYVLSAILTTVMSVFVIFEPIAIPVCVILKLLSIPVIWYLRSSLARGLGIYFYLNLGISRKEYWLIPVVVEFLAFVVLMIITGKIGYAIG